MVSCKQNTKTNNPQFCKIAYGLLECDTDLSSGCDLIFVI